MFDLFDEDGNGNISVEELLNMMAFFIEIGMDTGNVDMASTMAEVFQKGDRNRDDKLNKQEFIIVSIELMNGQRGDLLPKNVHLLLCNLFLQGMSGHPVTAKILEVKTIDALLSTF